MTAQVSAVGTTNSSKSVRSVAVASIGNILEWFDFTVYGFVAVIMAKHFFPASNEYTSLLLSFATFGAGFVARPIGAVVFGRMGDVKGRKFVLLLSMFLMAAGSFLIGIAPTFASIGMWASMLIVFARVVQGFSAGGEFGNAAAFLIEWAPEGRRGFYGSFHQVGTSGGLLVGSVLVAVLSTLLSPADFDNWGWRIPFLLGGTLALIGMYMRRNMDETPFFLKKSETDTQQAELIIKPILKCIGIVTLWTVSVFVTLVYMPTFTQKFGHLSRSDALWATTIALIVNVLSMPLAGYLSDRFGRRSLILIASVAFALLTVPFFQIIVTGTTFSTIAFILALFGLFSATIAATGPATISELFATKRRSTWVSIGSAIAVLIFGGFAPFIATLLIEKTGSPISPAYYVVACAILTGITALTLRETAKLPLR
jgi:MHS family proline/betaine transporter-like MFS transporter